MFSRHQRYLQKNDGTVYVYTEALAKRNDMKPWAPDNPETEETEPVTEEFLKTRTRPEIAGYAKSVFGKDISAMRKDEMVEAVLKFQSEE